MKITKKGQVTIPNHIRNLLGIMSYNEVDFIEEKGRVYLVKGKRNKKRKIFKKCRGIGNVSMIREQIMPLT